MKDNYKVYYHKFPDNKYYIGITKQSPTIRWGKDGNRYKEQPVYEAILRFGWDNIEHKVIVDGLSSSEAQSMEKELINKYDSIENGYNIDTGGGLGGMPWVELEYNGIMYSADELAEMSPYDIKSHDITTRVNNHGWSVEKAINTPLGKKNIIFNYNGKDYTIKQLYQIRINKDLSYNQIKNRILKHNWDVSRAITQSAHEKIQPFGVGEKKYEYNGVYYNTYELSRINPELNLEPCDITNRVNKHGWSIEDAISKPKRRSHLKYNYNGILYSANELVKFVKYDNIRPRDIRDRIEHGWSVEKALSTPKKIK